MNEINYTQAQYPINQRFAEGHNRYWEKLAAPGAWLSGAERVAVAKEVRQANSCTLCQQRKAALSPYNVDGAHETASDLPDTMVEVIHRVTTDPGRLTKTWFDGLMQQGLSPEQYVEIIGTLTCVLSIDEFCRGLDIPLNTLPEPEAGEPSHYRPDQVIEDGDGSWVPILPNVLDEGPESDLWVGRTGYVIRALSLVPNEVRYMLDLGHTHYMDYSQVWNVTGSPRGTLSRRQIEVVAARVSALNGCFY
jgi:alkylhydroperoxidase family enzyme